MLRLGLVLVSVMAAGVVACASGAAPTTSEGANLTESADAAVTTDGGTDADAAADAAVAIPTYDEVAPIIAQSCGGCHDDQFATLDAVKANGGSMLVMINKGRMPKGDPTFKSTPAGQELVTYLTSSPDLQ